MLRPRAESSDSDSGGDGGPSRHSDASSHAPVAVHSWHEGESSTAAFGHRAGDHGSTISPATEAASHLAGSLTLGDGRRAPLSKRPRQSPDDGVPVFASAPLDSAPPQAHGGVSMWAPLAGSETATVGDGGGAGAGAGGSGDVDVDVDVGVGSNFGDGSGGFGNGGVSVSEHAGAYGSTDAGMAGYDHGMPVDAYGALDDSGAVGSPGDGDGMRVLHRGWYVAADHGDSSYAEEATAANEWAGRSDVY